MVVDWWLIVVAALRREEEADETVRDFCMGFDFS